MDRGEESRKGPPEQKREENSKMRADSNHVPLPPKHDSQDVAGNNIRQKVSPQNDDAKKEGNEGDGFRRVHTMGKRAVGTM